MKKYFSFIFIIFIFFFIFNFNVKAYTIEYKDYSIDEEYIYNMFKDNFSDFDLNSYNKIICTFSIYSSYKHVIDCYASNEGYTLSNYAPNESASSILYAIENSNYYRVRYKLSDNSLINSSYVEDYTKTSGNTLGFVYLNVSTTSSVITYSNFNFDDLSNTLNEKINLLNFEKYTLDLKLNENLFSNNENFKKVCVDENTKFAITPTNENYSENGLYTDFIWFPYGLNDGLYKIQYDSSSEYFDGNVIIDTKDVQYENFYFSSYEKINSFYDTDLPSDFEEAGYTDKYSYYGYNAYKFFIVYKDGLFRYPIFVFDNPSITHISSSGTIHGGGGLRLDDDEEIELTNEYCFYIKKEYEVNEVNLDEWGDFYGSVISPDGDYDFNTSYNKNNTSTDGFLSQPIKFISEMSGTITFINTFIYNFYISMPLIVRTFMITALIILMVILIMKIGGYK